MVGAGVEVHIHAVFDFLWKATSGALEKVLWGGVPFNVIFHFLWIATAGGGSWWGLDWWGRGLAMPPGGGAPNTSTDINYAAERMTKR